MHEHAPEPFVVADSYREGLAYGTDPRPSETTAVEAVRLGGRLDHHLAAHREPDAPDPIRVDVGPAPEIVDGGVHVPLALPAEDVRVALALALAAAVEEEDAVPVADEHPRLPLCTPPPWKGDDRRAVLRGHVPALELRPSLVVNDTSSCAAPSSGGGTNPRATCVKTYDT